MVKDRRTGLDTDLLEEKIIKESVKFDSGEREASTRRLSLSFLFLFLYVLIIAAGVLVAYHAISDVIHAYNHPVRSTQYKEIEAYTAPAIILFPNGNEFLACGHYYNNIIGSVLSLSVLDLHRQNCSYHTTSYTDPRDNATLREAVIIKGPTNVEDVEALFIYFKSKHKSQDFYTVSYYALPFWDQVVQGEGYTASEVLRHHHGHVPTFALSANMRMWIKMLLREIYFIDHDQPKREFKYEMSVVQYLGSPPGGGHPFYIFFEWKTNFIERSHQVYAMTAWGLAAALIGMVLALIKTGSLVLKLRQRVTGVGKEVKKVHVARKQRRNRQQEPVELELE